VTSCYLFAASFGCEGTEGKAYRLSVRVKSSPVRGTLILALAEAIVPLICLYHTMQATFAQIESRMVFLPNFMLTE
jgi:hypothetical protein